MGAWGHDTFDNDTACDWTYLLVESDDLAPVEAAIDAALAAGTEYLDGDVGAEALAACEVLARLQGRWGPRNAYTESVDDWVTAHPIVPDAEVLERAGRAVDRVLTEPSELLELWDEGGRHEEWHAAVEDLRLRVLPAVD